MVVGPAVMWLFVGLGMLLCCFLHASCVVVVGPAECAENIFLCPFLVSEEFGELLWKPATTVWSGRASL